MESVALENAISDNVETPNFKNFSPGANHGGGASWKSNQLKVLVCPCLHAIRFCEQNSAVDRKYSKL
jgi:hypothetical protein